MANQEHLAILKQGVKVWNEWRNKNPKIIPDLKGTGLIKEDLGVIEYGWGVSLNINLEDADLSGAAMEEVNLDTANLKNANLSKAILFKVNLNDADLSGANLLEADFSGTRFDKTTFRQTNITGARLHYASFINLDLSEALGLEKVIHRGPSTIGIDTLYKSKGKIPEAFLIGCGVPAEMIRYIPSLVGSLQTIQYYSAFISHSTKDAEFAKRLYDSMRGKELRVWYAPEDLKGGEKLHHQIEQAIKIHDKLLIVLSENSIKSEWVKTEIRKAHKQEKQEGKRKLFPISLCSYETLYDWECIDSETGIDLAEELRQFYLRDFSNWKDHDAFEAAFSKLLKDLAGEKVTA